MLRSAAKNYASVTVVSDPADYARILDEMQTHKGDTTLKTRENLAVKVFMRTSNYDNAITNYLGHQSAESTKGSFCICAPLYQELRYGDNPHQEASLYGSFGDIFHQLQGKELSYTNVLDMKGSRADYPVPPPDGGHFEAHESLRRGPGRRRPAQRMAEGF